MPYEFLTAEYQHNLRRILAYSKDKGREEFPCPDAATKIQVLDDFGTDGWELMDWEKTLNGMTYWFKRGGSSSGGGTITIPTNNILGVPIDGRGYPIPLFWETDTKSTPVECATAGVEYLICALRLVTNNNKYKVLLKHMTLTCSDTTAQEFRYRLLLNPTIENAPSLVWTNLHASKPEFNATRGIIASPSTSKITDANKVLDGGYCRKLQHAFHVANIILPLMKDSDVIVLAATPLANNVEICGSMSGVLMDA